MLAIFKKIMKIVLLICFALPLLDAASELPAWHLKPFGSHVKPDPIDEVFPHNMISTEDFANKYVLPRKPIVFRDIVKDWPAFTKWTDDYLKEKYGKLELRLEAKKEKQGKLPKGDVCLGRDTMTKFLNDYKLGADKYVVSELPTPMWHEVLVPPPMACGEFLKSYVEMDLWINSDTGKKGNGGNSILHKDAFNTVNCVVSGTKDWKLIELQHNDYMYQSWEGPMDAGYGGFSLINPEKVNAKKHPNVGKIPNWLFTTINAGDCIFLPSQWWHQVKSYGETNRAVAFLFSQFLDKSEKVRKSINTTGCESSPTKLPLSDVDVDLQYPGTGTMTMGQSMIEDTRDEIMSVVDERTGLITPKSIYRMVYGGHSSGYINKPLIKEKTIKMYKLMKSVAGGKKEKMTEDVVKKLTRDNIREIYNYLRIVDPANAYTMEYSSFAPEDVAGVIEGVANANKGKIEKEKLMKAYEDDMGGTHKFAESLWQRLAGDQLVVDLKTANITAAVEPHVFHQRDKPAEEQEEDDEATITTPQGHSSMPKKMRGGYSNNEEDEEDEGQNPNQRGRGGQEQGDGPEQEGEEQEGDDQDQGDEEGEDAGAGVEGLEEDDEPSSTKKEGGKPDTNDKPEKTESKEEL